MKDEPMPIVSKRPRDRFMELGRKIMSVPKAEIDAREKEWRKVHKRKRS